MNRVATLEKFGDGFARRTPIVQRERCTHRQALVPLAMDAFPQVPQSKCTPNIRHWRNMEPTWPNDPQTARTPAHPQIGEHRPPCAAFFLLKSAVIAVFQDRLTNARTK